MHFKYYLIVLVLYVNGVVACPKECTCDADANNKDFSGMIVTCYDKGLTDVPPNLPEETEWLHLDGNNIEALAPGVFSKLPKLSRIYMSHNKIKTLDPVVFKTLPGLRTVDFSHNKIETFDAAVFNGHPKLQGIYMNYNKVNIISSTKFSGLPKFAHLHLDNNKIKTMDAEIFSDGKLPQFRILDIQDNPIKCEVSELEKAVKKLNRWSRVDCRDY